MGELRERFCGSCTNFMKEEGETVDSDGQCDAKAPIWTMGFQNDVSPYLSAKFCPLYSKAGDDDATE